MSEVMAGLALAAWGFSWGVAVGVILCFKFVKWCGAS